MNALSPEQLAYLLGRGRPVTPSDLRRLLAEPAPPRPPPRWTDPPWTPPTYPELED